MMGADPPPAAPNAWLFFAWWTPPAPAPPQAGLIMSIAFSGLVFSHIPVVSQVGFLIVYAVLVDSFIVRPLLVPAQMHLLGEAAYWPRRMPPASRCRAPPPPRDDATPQAERCRVVEEAGHAAQDWDNCDGGGAPSESPHRPARCQSAEPAERDTVATRPGHISV